MLKPTFILVSLLTVFASRVSACDVKSSTLGDFGLALLGSSGSAMPQGLKKLPGCQASQKYGYSDCELLDADGISYLMDSNILVRKELRISGYSKLPFGIKHGEDLLGVVREVSSIPQFPDLYIIYRDHGYILTSEFCLKNKLGELFELYFAFDRSGHFQSLGARAESPSD